MPLGESKSYRSLAENSLNLQMSQSPDTWVSRAERLIQSRGLNTIEIVTLSVKPTFDMPVINVTVTEKETAILPCSVKFLGNHQVVWTDQSSTLLAFNDRRIIDDERLSIERPFTKDWNLHIRKVKHEDQGVYNCQVNTVPVSIKIVNLIVEVPAKIIEHLSSEDIIVRENDKVTLICNVTGVPMPEVTWFRHEASPKGSEKQSEFCQGTDQVGVNGEVLIIHNITRYCGDTYECVAFNGVPPPVSHKIHVSVEFAPEIFLPNRRIGQDIGKETILECSVAAFPQAVSMWTRNGKKISTQSQKYRLEIYEDDLNTITLSLRMFSIELHDFGRYTCVASNPLGEDSESMILYEYSAHLQTTTRSPPRRTTTQMVVVRPPQVPLLPTSVSIFPPKTGRGDKPRSGNSYRPVTRFPDSWPPQQSGQGPQEKIIEPSYGENRNAESSIHHRLHPLSLVPLFFWAVSACMS